MPVVRKIKSEEFFREVAGEGMAYLIDNEIDDALLAVDVTDTYYAVIKFIKWYNNEKATTPATAD